MKTGKRIVSWSLRKKWTVVFGVLVVFTAVWLMGTATFMFNVKDTRFILGDMFSLGIKHNCLTAYIAAAYLASTGTDNIYSPLHYHSASPSSTPIHTSLHGIFRLDEYLYPPQFLLAPYGLLVLFKDFFAVRAAWFVLVLGFVITALAVVAWWCGAFHSQPRLLLFPLVLCAPTVHTTLQIGNVHILIVALSILAMVAFDEDHPLIGGALLGFATVAKIWPAILVVYFIVQRRWKAVAYCAIAMTVYTLGGILLFGLEPYRDFITYGLPRVSSGKAFFWMTNSQSIIENLSIFGIPHKLYALKLLPSQPELLSPSLGWGFTVILGVIVIATGLRRGKETKGNDKDRVIRVQVWLALLTLMQLRSPFLPCHYGVISTLWLLLLLTVSTKRWWTFGAIVAAWFALSVNMPLEFMPRVPQFNIVYTFMMLLVIYGAILFSLQQYYVHTEGWASFFDRHLDKPRSRSPIQEG